MTDEEKISRYDYTVNALEKLLVDHLEEGIKFDVIVEDKDIYMAHLHGLMVAYRNALYMLTRDKKWIKPLDELREELVKNKKYNFLKS